MFETANQWHDWQRRLLVCTEEIARVTRSLAYLKNVSINLAWLYPFHPRNRSVFICVCIQRSGLPLKLSRKVKHFILSSLKETKMGSKGKYFEYCVSAFKNPWLCISYLHDGPHERGNRTPEGSLLNRGGMTHRKLVFKSYQQFVHDTE